ARKNNVKGDGEGELQPRQQDGIEIHGFKSPAVGRPSQRPDNMSASLLNSARGRRFLRHADAMLGYRGCSGWGAAAMSDTASGSGGFLERQFRLRENGTDARTEFIAGATTFLTMVYIVFVNPQILGNAGMDKGAVFVATCIASAVSTSVMALYANYPIALAPGMGLNAFFAFTE